MSCRNFSFFLGKSSLDYRRVVHISWGLIVFVSTTTRMIFLVLLSHVLITQDTLFEEVVKFEQCYKVLYKYFFF
jgi:hypothetical protein